MFVTSPLFQQLGVRHGFTTRRGGVSLPPYDTFNLGLKTEDRREDVQTNLQLLAQRLATTPQRLFWAAQESRDQILTISENDQVDKVRATPADALIYQMTTNDAPVLCIRTADCLPVLIYAPLRASLAATKGKSSGVWIGAVHVGWQGAYLQLLAKTLSQLKGLGVAINELCLAMGPAIGPCCLRLAGRVKEDFEAKFPGHAAIGRRPDDPSAIYLDLWQHSKSLALEWGVLEKNINILNSCTSCERHHFFSYRRDGVATGRHLSFIG